MKIYPEDITREILSFLTHQDLNQVALVDKRLYKLAREALPHTLPYSLYPFLSFKEVLYHAQRYDIILTKEQDLWQKINDFAQSSLFHKYSHLVINFLSSPGSYIEVEVENPGSPFCSILKSHILVLFPLSKKNRSPLSALGRPQKKDTKTFDLLLPMLPLSRFEHTLSTPFFSRKERRLDTHQRKVQAIVNHLYGQYKKQCIQKENKASLIFFLFGCLLVIAMFLYPINKNLDKPLLNPSESGL